MSANAIRNLMTAFYAFSGLLVVAKVGKPQSPTTGPEAALILVVVAGLVWGIWRLAAL